MSSKRVTVRDVARQAGVSPGTVSRVLASRDASVRISEATRARVLAVSRALQYNSDALASSLRSRRSSLIGVVVPNLTMAFPVAALDHLGTVLEQRGYHFLLAQARTEADVQRFSHLYERFRVRGVLLVGTSGEMLGDACLSEYCRGLDGHVVGLLWPPGPPLLVSVDIDNRRGMHLALNYLRDLGHERIAYVGGDRAWDFAQRLDAFREYVGAAALNAEPELVQATAAASPREGGAAVLRLLALSRPPSAIVCATDEMALAGMMAAQQAGYSVPGDVSLVGFDDMGWASYCFPPLTTVRQPIQAMVELAVECLMNLVENGPDEQLGRAFVFPPELVVRESAAKYRGPTERNGRRPARR